MSAPTRRALLLGAAAVPMVALAGCSSEEPAPAAIPVQPTTTPAPEENLLDELTLIGAYEGAIVAFPELRGSLASIAEQHRAHARELGADDATLAGVEPIPPSATRPRATLTELIKRERAAGSMRAEAAAADSDTARVRALTFIAASESSHVPELQDVRKGVGSNS